MARATIVVSILVDGSQPPQRLVRLAWYSLRLCLIGSRSTCVKERRRCFEILSRKCTRSWRSINSALCGWCVVATIVQLVFATARGSRSKRRAMGMW